MIIIELHIAHCTHMTSHVIGVDEIADIKVDVMISTKKINKS